VAADDLVDLCDRLLELDRALGRLPGDLDLGEDGEVEAELALVEDRAIAADDAGIFERLQAPQAG
jgi:hypothetical protein